MSNLFDSIFNNATAAVDPLRLLLALLVSLFLGLAYLGPINTEHFTLESLSLV